jgi:hypothetical protein
VIADAGIVDVLSDESQEALEGIENSEIKEIQQIGEAKGTAECD